MDNNHAPTLLGDRLLWHGATGETCPLVAIIMILTVYVKK
jgi:hypothetical protein